MYQISLTINFTHQPDENRERKVTILYKTKIKLKTNQSTSGPAEISSQNNVLYQLFHCQTNYSNQTRSTNFSIWIEQVSVVMADDFKITAL